MPLPLLPQLVASARCEFVLQISTYSSINVNIFLANTHARTHTDTVDHNWGEYYVYAFDYCKLFLNYFLLLSSRFVVVLSSPFCFEPVALQNLCLVFSLLSVGIITVFYLSGFQYRTPRRFTVNRTSCEFDSLPRLPHTAAACVACPAKVPATIEHTSNSNMLQGCTRVEQVTK